MSKEQVKFIMKEQIETDDNSSILINLKKLEETEFFNYKELLEITVIILNNISKNPRIKEVDLDKLRLIRDNLNRRLRNPKFEFLKIYIETLPRHSLALDSSLDSIFDFIINKSDDENKAEKTFDRYVGISLIVDKLYKETNPTDIRKIKKFVSLIKKDRDILKYVKDFYDIPRFSAFIDKASDFMTNLVRDIGNFYDYVKKIKTIINSLERSLQNP